MTEPKRTPLKNVSRERMQAELRHLRELVVQLAKERDRLVEKAKTSIIQLGEPQQEVAEEEYNKRKQAEELNTQLHGELEEQAATIHRLKELILHQMHQVDDVHSARHSAFDHVLFNSLSDDIDVGYRMTDSIVNTVNWDDETTRGSWRLDTKVSQHNGQTHTVIELQKQFWTPTTTFIEGEGEVASWNHISQLHLSSQYHIDQLVAQDDSFAVQYHHPYWYHGRQVNVFANELTKRFVEGRREVRVWRSKFQGQDAQNESTMLVDVAGWAVIQPFGKGIVTRICAHFVPRILESSCSGLAPGEKYERAQEFAYYAIEMLQMKVSQSIDKAKGVECGPILGV
ncbi:hypothetical protein Poli38472_004950 [Pythium oligandrum]|uniref:Uncharacterized protein n=1 Tax=Pythium oligandrum TaxID=41045 RepID=A0A8K1FEW3_PYTOL|nr:hypothetical protein Poli38472_004950 [Pythium oligandrum]|eukprot:TMW59881.1 hypothetical protein Poli38472_004950 [Pythium oligandrum]